MSAKTKRPNILFRRIKISPRFAIIQYIYLGAVTAGLVCVLAGVLFGQYIGALMILIPESSSNNEIILPSYIDFDRILNFWIKLVLTGIIGAVAALAAALPSILAGGILGILSYFLKWRIIAIQKGILLGGLLGLAFMIYCIWDKSSIIPVDANERTLVAVGIMATIGLIGGIIFREANVGNISERQESKKVSPPKT